MANKKKKPTPKPHLGAEERWEKNHSEEETTRKKRAEERWEAGSEEPEQKKHAKGAESRWETELNDND